MKTKVIEIPITVYGDEASVDYNEDETIVVSDLTLVHIQTPEEMMNNPLVTFYRKVPVIEGCSVETFCYCFGATCDEIYLPPGEYEMSVEIEGAKYTPNGTYEMTMAFEEVDQAYTLATQLNALGGCQ